MNILRKYKSFNEVLTAFLPEKEIQVCRKAYLSYTRTRDVFTQWLKDRGMADKSMRKITTQDIADFSVYLAGLKYDKPTCEKFIMNLKVIFKYALKRGEIEALPFDRDLLVFPKKGKDCSAALIPSHIVPQLLSDIKENDPQLFLACMLEFYCGIRPGREVRLVKVRNFDLIEGVLTIEAEQSKNGKAGHITMSEELVEICREYGIADADPDLYVFGKNKHLDSRPLSENMLRYRFNQYKNKLNLPNSYKFYSFKHTGASMLHKSGISMRELMDQLRHTRLSATEHYLKKHCGIINERIKFNFPDPLKDVI